MPATAMIAAAFAILTAASPPALAAQATEAATTPPAGTSVTTTRVMPDQIRASELKGSAVYDREDHEIASVKDMVFDRSGRVAAVVLDVNGKNIGVPMQSLQIAMNNGKLHVATDMTAAQLASAQAFNLNAKPASGGSTSPAR